MADGRQDGQAVTHKRFSCLLHVADSEFREAFATSCPDQQVGRKLNYQLVLRWVRLPDRWRWATAAARGRIRGFILERQVCSARWAGIGRSCPPRRVWESAEGLFVCVFVVFACVFRRGDRNRRNRAAALHLRS